jgi:ribosomal protein L21E
MKISDGTTGVVVETDGTKKALNVNVTDGTNDMPTADVNTRALWARLTDGTSDLTLLTGTVKTIPSTIHDGTTGAVVETDGTKKALNVNVTDGTNDMPTGDAVGRSLYTAIGDGTTTAVVETAGTKKAVNVNITDGTNDMPTMDAVGRQGIVQLADGVNVISVLAGTTKTLPVTNHDGTNPETLVDIGAIYGHGVGLFDAAGNRMPSGDDLARAIHVALGDGTTEADVIATINSLKTDFSSIAGTATSVGAGSSDSGTQRVVIANTSPAVVQVGGNFAMSKVDITPPAGYTSSKNILYYAYKETVALTGGAAATALSVPAGVVDGTNKVQIIECTLAKDSFVPTAAGHHMELVRDTAGSSTVVESTILEASEVIVPELQTDWAVTNIGIKASITGTYHVVMKLAYYTP